MNHFIFVHPLPQLKPSAKDLHEKSYTRLYTTHTHIQCTHSHQGRCFKGPYLKDVFTRHCLTHATCNNSHWGTLFPLPPKTSLKYRPKCWGEYLSFWGWAQSVRMTWPSSLPLAVLLSLLPRCDQMLKSSLLAWNTSSNMTPLTFSACAHALPHPSSSVTSQRQNCSCTSLLNVPCPIVSVLWLW